MIEPDSFPAVDTTNQLFQDAYARLKAMASRHRARAGEAANLCTTELVHELYLRISGEQGPSFQRELEFFSYAARAMRHVLIDLSRKNLSLKSGADLVRVSITDPGVGVVAIEPMQALELDSALAELEREAPRAAKVLELHYFAGLTLDEIARLLGASERTIDRDWRFARSFLTVRLQA